MMTLGEHPGIFLICTLGMFWGLWVRIELINPWPTDVQKNVWALICLYLLVKQLPFIYPEGWFKAVIFNVIVLHIFIFILSIFPLAIWKINLCLREYHCFGVMNPHAFFFSLWWLNTCNLITTCPWLTGI